MRTTMSIYRTGFSPVTDILSNVKEMEYWSQTFIKYIEAMNDFNVVLLREAIRFIDLNPHCPFVPDWLVQEF